MNKKISSPELQNNLWMLIATMLFAPFSAIMVLITTRLVGIETAGMMQYSVAVTAILVQIVLFSTNQIQMVDIHEEYSFRTYLGLRTFTSVLASLVLILFLFIVRFEQTHAIILLLYFFIFLTDGYVNVFMTDFHQKGKVRIMGRMRASGFAGVLAAFFITVLITHNVVMSLLAAGVLLLIIYVIWILYYREHFGAMRTKYDFSAMKRLGLAVTPILVLTFAMNFLIAAPSIYLGEFDTIDMVAILAILVAPPQLFMVLVHALVLGSPVPETSDAYSSGDLGRFRRRIHAKLLFTFGMSIPFVAFTYFLGAPILSWLYGVDVSPYRIHLAITSIGGIFATTTPIIGLSLVIMQKQKQYMYAYIATSLITGPLVAVLVWLYGIHGAVFSQLLVFLPLTVVIYLVFRRMLYLKSKNASV